MAWREHPCVPDSISEERGLVCQGMWRMVTGMTPGICPGLPGHGLETNRACARGRRRCPQGLTEVDGCHSLAAAWHRVALLLVDRIETYHSGWFPIRVPFTRIPQQCLSNDSKIDLVCRPLQNGNSQRLDVGAYLSTD